MFCWFCQLCFTVIKNVPMSGWKLAFLWQNSVERVNSVWWNREQLFWCMCMNLKALCKIRSRYTFFFRSSFLFGSTAPHNCGIEWTIALNWMLWLTSCSKRWPTFAQRLTSWGASLAVRPQPHSPDNRATAQECKDVKIDRVYIGSCTGGKTEDFVAAAKLLHTAVCLNYILGEVVVKSRSKPNGAVEAQLGTFTFTFSLEDGQDLCWEERKTVFHSLRNLYGLERLMAWLAWTVQGTKVKVPTFLVPATQKVSLAFQAVNNSSKEMTELPEVEVWPIFWMSPVWIMRVCVAH